MDSSDEDSPEIETLDISNDQHYQVLPSARLKSTIHDAFHNVPKYGSPTIRHCLPAYDLWKPFFPTYLDGIKLRTLHRPPLRHYHKGPMAVRPGQDRLRAFPIKSCAREIYRSQKDLRNKVARAMNSRMSRDEIISKVTSIIKAKDLTAKRGELFLMEYSEENPPVLSERGMASNLKTYVIPNAANFIAHGARRPVLAKSNRDNINPSQETTTSTTTSHTAPIISDMTTAVSDQNAPSLKTASTIGIREILSEAAQRKPIYYSDLKPGTETMFIENNLYRAPIYPHEVNDCDFLIIRTRNGFYVRTFHKIYTVGQTMPLDLIPPPTDRNISRFRSELSNLYIHKLCNEYDPDHPAIDLDQLVKLFPDYPRVLLRKKICQLGLKSLGDGCYALNGSQCSLKSLKQVRSIIKPEQYCLYMSMLANRQRLRDLNYLESMIVPTDTVKLETEVLAASWNTSKAIHERNLNHCYLDFKQHLIDPTGPRREGFSCISWVKSPTEEEQKSQLNEPPTRNSSQPATIPMVNPVALKIKREKLERLATFQKEAQLITKVQSDVLGSHEVLSSDEGSDAEEEDEDVIDSQFDQQAKDLDRLVVDGRTTDELNFEREEEERQELMRSFVNLPEDKAVQEGSKQTKAQDHISQYRNKVLRIVRRYKTKKGADEYKTEIVREPQIIARYAQMKSSNGPSPEGVIDNVKNNLQTPETTASPLPNEDNSSNHFMRRGSLGPSELCSLDGTTLRISKSVLKNSRPMRRFSSRQ